MLWNPEVETLDRAAMQSLQLERLRATVDRVLRNVAPLRDRLVRAGITSADTIRSLDDVRRLPFSTKDDLIDHYPFGLLAVPREQVVRIHASSGTKGMPKIPGRSTGCISRLATRDSRLHLAAIASTNSLRICSPPVVCQSLTS